MSRVTQITQDEAHLNTSDLRQFKLNNRDEERAPRPEPPRRKSPGGTS